MGDAEATEAAFAGADHVTKLRLVNNRCFVSAMEPRAAVAEYDGEGGRYTLYVGSQGVMGMRNILDNAILQCPPEQNSRSEERRIRKECVSTFTYRWSTVH